ncbi:MAG: hypothetical protein Q8Q28_08050 [Pseudomonadota bacterium]|nr:hypothetical protein [Pseudomonadota bacterium]
MTLDVRYQTPIRWESASRYYVALIHHDLFNNLVVSRYWGGKGSRAGGAKHEVLNSIEEGMEKIRMFGKDRARHGYKVVAGGPSQALATPGVSTQP